MTELLPLFTSTPSAQICIGILGLIFGSFFNVCIERIPNDESVFLGRSKCPRCSYQIPWFLNVPLVSYLFLKGKCQNCKKRISIQYPIVEASTALLYLLLFYFFGPTFLFLAYVLLASLLLIISVIDLHHQIIPDELSLSGLVLGFVFSFFLPDVGWKESLAGILIGGGIFYAVAAIYERVTGREGLGGGDVKLLGMIGAWLGIRSILPVIILSSALGSVVGIAIMSFKKKSLKAAIPFGPFLAASALVYLLFGPQIRSVLLP